jgi:GT2 family glycosyltransferase
MAAPETRQQNTSDPLISVVVCTHNRADKLANCLARLSDQSLERSRYEVIVVDDCSADGTPAVVQRSGARLMRNERNLGPAASRNVGARATSAPLVAFTDDDCVPDREWLGELVTAFDDGTVVAAGGKIEPARTDRLLLRYYEASNPLSHNPHRPDHDSGPFGRFGAYLLDSFHLHALPEADTELRTIASANMAVRRSEFDALGGFDERFGLGGEDDDLSLRLRRLRPEGRLVYVPDAVVAHDYDASLRDALRRNRTYGRAAGVAYLKGDGRLPAIFPFPVLILMSFALVAVDLRLLAVPFALLILLYPGWVRLAFARRNPAYVGFPVLQAAFELQTTIGFSSYLAGERRVRPRPEPR